MPILRRQPRPDRHHRRRRRQRLSPCSRPFGSIRGRGWPASAMPARSCSRSAARTGAATTSRPTSRRSAPIPNVDAVIIATPNFTHKPITLAAAKHGKHVMCEKPLGLNAGEVRAMYHACRDAKVVHMTAFTYRFAPSMRYLRHLAKSGALGELRHFRSQRFLDWPETSWGWRQYKRPGRGGRPVRHDDPPDRLCDRPDGAARSRCAERRPASPRGRRRPTARTARPARSMTGRA